MPESEEIQKLLDDTALWVIEVLKQLEGKAQIVDPGHPQGFENILNRVEGAIIERLDRGAWRSSP
jgi:hypothetical protein